MLGLQSEETRREYQDLEMATDMQRCNSAPDLRILLDGQINPVPALNRLPVMASSSVTGAIVPFKAPQVCLSHHCYVSHHLLRGLGDRVGHAWRFFPAQVIACASSRSDE